MRHWLIVITMLAGACAPAASAENLGYDNARHLLARTCFAAPAGEIEKFAQLTREQAAERLLALTGTMQLTPAPAWVNEPPIAPRQLREMSVEERQAMRRMFVQRGMEMRVWWMQEMLATQHPLTEKMVLFWHNHFVSSTQKVRQPQYMYRKLWREFVSPVPDVVEVRRIGAIFRDSRYDIRTALRALLVSDAFYDVRNRASLVKSPVDLVVGTLRQFQFAIGDPQPFAVTVSQLGQNLFAPPNVRGWPGGNMWINSTTLLARKQFVDRLFRAEEIRPAMAMAALPNGAQGANGGFAAETRQRFMRGMAEVQFDSARWSRQADVKDANSAARLVLAMAPHTPLSNDATGLELVRRLTLDPAYQLK